MINKLNRRLTALHNAYLAEKAAIKKSLKSIRAAKAARAKVERRIRIIGHAEPMNYAEALKYYYHDALKEMVPTKSVLLELLNTKTNFLGASMPIPTYKDSE